MKLCLVSNAQFVWEDLIAWGGQQVKREGAESNSLQTCLVGNGLPHLAAKECHSS